MKMGGQILKSIITKRKKDSLENVVSNNTHTDTATIILLQQSSQRLENLNTELDTKIKVTI